MKDEELIVVGGSFLGMVLASVVVLLWLRADVEQEESTSYYVYPRPFRDRSQRAEVERQVKAWAERNPEDWARMHGR